MLLSDLGAEVLRIDRRGGTDFANSVVDRGRSSLSADLKTVAGRDLSLAILDKADVLVEGMRPGVMERLGLGPEVVCDRNPAIVYARMTGWGQNGPLARAAGHDINYIALTGALAALGSPDAPPRPPLNLVGDFGGGSLYLAFGIMAALWERMRSGRGQVVDAAIVDGVASMMAMFGGLLANGSMSLDRDRSLLGGAAPHYRCYACADGKYIAVGALEPKFFRQLIRSVADAIPVESSNSWPETSASFEAIFRQRTRSEWCELLEGTDCCFAPILTFDEAPSHPHIAERQTYFNWNGVIHPAPAPRFSRTPAALATREAATDVLRRWGLA